MAERTDPMYKELKRLYKHELYSNVTILADILLSTNKNVPNFLKPEEHLLVLMYFADSSFKMLRFEKAEKLYQSVIDHRKQYSSNKVLITAENKIPSDTDLKYNICQCLLYQNKRDHAYWVLESIPAKDRTPKVNTILAEYYSDKGMTKEAIACYKDVLKECPLALAAAEGLLKLGVQGVEVNSFIATGQFSTLPWLNTWVKAYAYMHSNKFSSAVKTFASLLTSPSLLSHSITLMISLGEALYCEGSISYAKRVLNRVLRKDQSEHKAYCLLGAICLTDKDNDELVKLIPSDWETWVSPPPNRTLSEKFTTVACLMFAQGRLTTASVFAQYACKTDWRNVEALVVRGAVVYELNRYQSAALHYREALRIASHRFEPHKGLVECYLSQNQFKEALNIAVNCCIVDNNSPRSLTLQAYVLIKEGSQNREKAKQLLQKALESNRSFLNAITLLIGIYEEEGATEALNLLEKQAAEIPCSNLHLCFADILQKDGNKEKAFEHYRIALRIDPDNKKAKEGLQRLESSMQPTKDTKFPAPSKTNASSDGGPSGYDISSPSPPRNAVIDNIDIDSSEAENEGEGRNRNEEQRQEEEQEEEEEEEAEEEDEEEEYSNGDDET